MSKDSVNSNSPNKVISKYFSSNSVMDESSDFKQKKSGYIGPKISSKSTTSKIKAKKSTKRIKGQKDIRSVLKPKNNELITYAKQFSEVCRQSGVDIDAEQLQLAIALSKSIQPTDKNDDESECTSSNTKNSSAKIRTTLQQYGFQVPEIKITSKKRQKKSRKDYKLLLSSSQEKQQIISDKYAQIIFESISHPSKKNLHTNLSDAKLYYLATSILYLEIRNNESFYVDNLVEKSSSKGSLFRDWANIPGRPESPKAEQTLTMNFSEIDCSQDELDVVLSGTLKSAKNIIEKKVRSVSNNSHVIVIEDLDKENPGPKIKNSDITTKSLYLYDKSCNNTCLTMSCQIRSCSPDIFDDERSEILDDTLPICDQAKDLLPGQSIRHSEEEEGNISSIDLTGADEFQTICKDQDKFDVHVLEVKNLGITKDCATNSIDLTICRTKVETPFSQENNTQRNSNDLMEITECVADSDEFNLITKQVLLSGSLQTNLTQITNDNMEITECVAKTMDVFIKVDLTQRNDENSEVSLVDGLFKGNTSEAIDILQSSDSEDELPFVNISGNNKSLDETILLNNEEIGIKGSEEELKIDDVLVNSEEPIYSKTQDDVLDLTQSPVSNSGSHSFFDDFVHNHSDDLIIENSNKIKICGSGNSINVNPEEDIDLTQTSNSSNEKGNNTPFNETNLAPFIQAGLGKKDEVSIDYDDLFDNVTKQHNKNYEEEGQRKTLNTLTDEIDDKPQSGSQDSNFNIYDQELEYSINKSHKDLAWDINFGGTSVLDSITDQKQWNDRKSDNLPETNEVIFSKTKFKRESFLPDVNMMNSYPDTKETRLIGEIDQHPIGCNKDTLSTPFKTTNINVCTINTPQNTEYIVKTDQVTPMLDYASMNTPERNKELDKYGLKPFKRKRAIQLLTHLYHQTHPVVDTCPEGHPSPSKRRKPSNVPSPQIIESPKKVEPTRKFMKSPTKLKTDEMKKSNDAIDNIYEITKNLPDIREIFCPQEDWVFQKREKAKLHSCRVPLHIAFHNYVSCRRKLREAILQYEPINIDVVHKELVASGYRYDPKDLLKYLDKKCITVKTADNNGRNSKR